MTASFPISDQRTCTHTPTIRLGISSCLLGTKVRYDGGHKRDAFIVDTLGQFFEWVPVCPETEVGLGTPRESLRLAGSVATPRLLTVHSQHDLTETMQPYVVSRVEELAQLNLHGFLLKKGSPSCGLERVRIYDQHGTVKHYGRGLLATALMQRLPLLPVEDERRLHDMRLRENFIERVFAYYRWQELCTLPPTPHDMVRFHSQHTLTLLAHSREHYQTLGQLIAQAGTLPLDTLQAQYGARFMACLKVKATPKKHANVLYHLLGHLKKQLDTEDKHEIITSIEHYRQELIPLVVPITLLRHHFRRYPIPWVLEQTYLQPYPMELMLRHHV